MELADGGGDHACPAGGYTCGNGEGPNGGINGEGSFYTRTYDATKTFSAGGYYLRYSTPYFGQGGYWCTNAMWGRDYAGSGGQAGAGGTIYYSKQSRIYAYNGNMITNNDYETIYKEYDKDGNLLSNVLTVITRTDINGNVIKFIPAKIFAQSGVIRATYKTNQHMTEEECNKYGVGFFDITQPPIWSSNIKVTEEKNTAVTNYRSPDTRTLINQGIGSGAGYLEATNGTYVEIE